MARRISSDWIEKYGHPLYLLESFVEGQRFRGICYFCSQLSFMPANQRAKALNDRYATLKVPIKDIYLYPLTKRFREALKPERVGEQKGGQVEDDK